MRPSLQNSSASVIEQVVRPLDKGKHGSALEDLLNAILERPTASTSSVNVLRRFLQETNPARALQPWLVSLENLRGAALKRTLVQRLNRDIARLDACLNEQVNAILHHPDFQKLEASWRSLRTLVQQVPEGSNVQIRVLNVSWTELTRDFNRALEFDQSQLFRKVYSEEFGTPGGKPFGILIGDYEVRHHPNDLETLSALAAVAAAAFAPFVASAHPSLLDLTSFADLEKPLNLTQTFEDLAYLKWRALRDREDSRFVGLTLPHVLVRLPYVDDVARVDEFRFHENVASPDRRDYLWGNAAYAFATVVIRAFIETGWLADIRGARRGERSGGLVTSLPVHHFGTDKWGVAPKCSTDTTITDAQEKELGTLGFIPLCPCHDTVFAAFYGNRSIQVPKNFNEVPAAVNAQISAMLQYILCASRFAHYLKVIGRDQIGKFTSATELQHFLQKWIMQYTSVNDREGWKFPLRDAKVEVAELADKPGSYTCRMFLRPHYQLDQLSGSLRLDSTLSPPRS
jgi:type VI secretion system protein ImpD